MTKPIRQEDQCFVCGGDLRDIRNLDKSFVKQEMIQYAFHNDCRDAVLRQYVREHRSEFLARGRVI
jgi:hypothetical protein